MDAAGHRHAGVRCPWQRRRIAERIFDVPDRAGIVEPGFDRDWAAGGAAYGKRPNSYQRPRWDVRLRYDTGIERTVNQSYEPLFQVGDRVRVYGSQLEVM